MAKKFTKDKILALIPARKGSERIINKNIVKLINNIVTNLTVSLNQVLYQHIKMI